MTTLDTTIDGYDLAKAPTRTKLHLRRGLKSLALVGVALVMVGYYGMATRLQPTNPELNGLLAANAYQHGQLNLLRGGQWKYMLGTTATDNTLQVHRSSEAVLALTDDEAGRPPVSPKYQANPPVNLYGTHLAMKSGGDVGVQALLTGIKTDATVSLLSGPNVRYDERVEHAAGIDVTVRKTTAIITIWDGENDKPAQKQTMPIKIANGTAMVDVRQRADVLQINVGGNVLQLHTPVFAGQVWFGFDTSSTFSVNNLEAYSVGNNSIASVDTSTLYDKMVSSKDGLSGVAAANGHGDKQIGTAVDLAVLMSNPQYTQFVIQNFNEIETEMLAKFQALQPREGQFEFAELDALVDFANKHNLTVHGHALAFTEAYPAWLNDKLKTASKEEALALLQNHIQTVLSRYDGKHGHGTINNWDVVNEAFDPDTWDQLNKQSIWYRSIGPDYIAEAFRTAHQANPEAKLFINEWGMETDSDRWDGMLALLKQLQAEDVPINGVGFQAHMDEDTILDDATLQEFYGPTLAGRFATLNNMGLSFRISEASVGSDDDSVQSDVYKKLLKLCLDASNCTAFNMWGAANSQYGYFYYTANPEEEDPGNDAPVFQAPDGMIDTKPVWDILLKTAAQ